MGNEAVDRVKAQVTRSGNLGQSLVEWEDMCAGITEAVDSEEASPDDVFQLVDEALDAYEAAKA